MKTPEEYRLEHLMESRKNSNRLATMSRELSDAAHKYEIEISSNVRQDFVELRKQINQEYDKITIKKNELLKETELLEKKLIKTDSKNETSLQSLTDSCSSLAEIDESVSLQQFKDDLAEFKKKLESFTKLDHKWLFGKIEEKN